MTDKQGGDGDTSEAVKDSVTREVSREPVTLTRNPSHWIAPLALVLALVGVGLATWGLFNASSEKPVFQQQGGDPKQRVCSAFVTVSNGVHLQTHADFGPEPAAVQAVAANARLALVGGGQYLLSRLGPDTPQDLADAVRSFANNLADIGMNQLAGLPDDDQAQANRLSEGQKEGAKVAALCK